MLVLYYIQLLVASLCFALSGVAMKLSEGLTRPMPSLYLVLLVLVGASSQALAMRHAGLGQPYLIVVGLEAIVATILGITLFQEVVSLSRILAIVLVLGGLSLLR